MKREEINRMRFGIEQRSRQISKEVIETLEQAKDPKEVDSAIQKAQKQLDQIMKRHQELKNQGVCEPHQMEEQKDLLGFANLLKDNAAQASQFKGKSSNPIRFHVYN